MLIVILYKVEDIIKIIPFQNEMEIVSLKIFF